MSRRKLGWPSEPIRVIANDDDIAQWNSVVAGFIQTGFFEKPSRRVAAPNEVRC
jgi:hypothetical protein